ncbi:MAG: HAD family hydrolase [Nanoarchaeota archaeon]|nr:HAD family hydrolase [Nanoarchaeota archaeon]
MKPLIILDLDGTLYNFDNSNSVNFTFSKFYDEIKKKVYTFLSRKLGVGEDNAREIYESIKTEFNGEVSLGLEAKFCIDRYEFFGETWSLDPSRFIEKANRLPLIKSLDGEIVFLTSAPRVWASEVLKYLDLNDYQERLFTGEPNLRKPDPKIFLQICDRIDIPPQRSISVGDQVHSDILPAKSVGMKTVLVRGNSTEADYCINSVDELPELIRRIRI